MKNLTEKLFAENFTQIFLSVQKSNEVALNFYKKLGFKIFCENKVDDDLIMIFIR